MMRNLWIDIWELFFPRYCVVCGKRLLQGEDHLCFRCLSGLPRTKLHLHPDNEMEKNLWGKMPLVRAASLLYYAKGNETQKVLYELKYYGNAKLGLFLGKWMAAELGAFFEGVDYIVPVPLHEKKKRKRGYNQSEMLAQGLSVETGIPVVAHGLVRNDYTETQTHKGNYERWENVKDVFACVNREAFEGKHILLVDDVVTTGATVVACADALTDIPGLRISVLSFALAGHS